MEHIHVAETGIKYSVKTTFGAKSVPGLIELRFLMRANFCVALTEKRNRILSPINRLQLIHGCPYFLRL